MTLVAVNICLISSAFDAAAIPLSWELCPTESYGSIKWDTEKTYRLVTLAQKSLHRGQGYPHCTVAQICVCSNQIDALRNEVRQIWRAAKEAAGPTEALSLLEIDNGPSFAMTEDGTAIHLPKIKIELSDALRCMHEKIVSMVRQYHVPPASFEVGKDAFHPNFPVDNVAAVEWVKNFLTDHALDAYDPHITLGSSPAGAAAASLFKPIQTLWSECRLVVSRMGNYNSCFELIS